MTLNGARARRRFACLLTCTAIAAGCSDNEGKGSGSLVEFTNQQSDIAMVYPRADGTVVVLRGEDSERAWYLELVDPDGTTTEMVQNADGRLVEVSLLQHRFALSDYTATDVVITHFGPDGNGVAERVSLSDPNAAPVAGKQLALDSDDSDGDSWLSKKIQEFADASNFHPVLMPIKKFIDKGVEKWTAAERAIQETREKVGGVTQKIRNALTCGTATRRQCAEQVAQQAPSMLRELRSIDPEGTTSAGFNVSERGIQPKRDEWQVEMQQRTVPLGFTLTDVPCEQSVFADMNPDCPQYVPPMSGTPTADAGIPSSDAGTPSSDAGTPASDAGSPGTGGGVSGNYPKDDASCRSTMFADGRGWQCKTWREEYHKSGMEESYLQFRKTNGLLDDSFGVSIQNGKAFAYGVHNYEYDASGAKLREEQMHWDTLDGIGSHEVSTAEGGGWFHYEKHECWNNWHKHVVSRQGSDPLTQRTMVISDVTDSNFEKCPTVDRVKALSAQVFPEVQLSESLLTGSRAYMLYLAQ